MGRLCVAGVVLSLLLPSLSAGQTSESFEQLAGRARAALEAQRVPEAIGLYGRATQLRPAWAEGWWRLGGLLYDAGRFSEARTAFGNFVAVEKRQPGPGYAMLGLSEFQLQHYPAALAALERGRHLGLGSNPVFNRGVLYHEGILNTFLGQPEIAIERLKLAANQIAAAHPDAPKAAALADSELVEALGIAALRMKKLPSGIPAGDAGLVRRAGRVQTFIALLDGASAEPELKEMVALYPNAAGVHYLAGVFLLKEHPPLALAEFQREIEISPGHEAARTQIAIEYLRAGEFDKGLKFAREAVKLAPGNFVAHVACGRLYLELGNTAGAIEELRTAVRLAPNSPDAHFALSRALVRAGRAGEAARERAEFERLKAGAEAER